MLCAKYLSGEVSTLVTGRRVWPRTRSARQDGACRSSAKLASVARTVRPLEIRRESMTDANDFDPPDPCITHGTNGKSSRRSARFCYGRHLPRVRYLSREAFSNNGHSSEGNIPQTICDSVSQNHSCVCDVTLAVAFANSHMCDPPSRRHRRRIRQRVAC
jgi:hypothetical protein